MSVTVQDKGASAMDPSQGVIERLRTVVAEKACGQVGVQENSADVIWVLLKNSAPELVENA